MKINFSQAALTDLDGNPILNAAGEPQKTDYKHLANQLFPEGAAVLEVLHLDNVEICSAINRGEEIELTQTQVERLKSFINSLFGTKGNHATAWIKLLEQEPKKNKKE